MAELDPLEVITAGVDSTPAMQARRWLSGEAAGEPDQYDTALLQIIRYLGGGALETLVDIGCNSGDFVLDGLQHTQESAITADPKVQRMIQDAKLGQTQVYGLDILPEEKALYFATNSSQNRLKFRQVIDPVRLPIASDSADGVLALNVLFRTDAHRMLHEIRRVLRPGGIAALSSNFSDHAWFRHDLTSEARKFAMADLRGLSPTTITRMPPPAEGAYYTDLKEMAEGIPGLSFMGEQLQRTELKITFNNLDEYIIAMQLEASRTGLPPELHIVYRALVRELAERHFLVSGGTFTDLIHRGVMTVMKVPT